jgi:hypothetical protein
MRERHHHQLSVVTYPTGCVGALFTDRQQAEAAAEALRAAGFAVEDIVMLHGPPAHAEIERVAHERHRLERWWAAVRDGGSDEGMVHHAFLDALGGGCSAVLVYAPHERQVERAHTLLYDAHGSRMVRFGRWTVAYL